MHTGTDIRSVTKDRLAEWLEDQGIRAYRAIQILKWVYQRQARSFDPMTDINKKLRKLLAEHFTISTLHTQQVEASSDGSKKFLFRLADGNFIESVLIPERDHYTLCISSQVGCAQGCRFCMTAKGGLVRNLTSGEIIGQVLEIKSSLGPQDRLTNIVFMGMGEPFANFSNVVHAIHVLTDNQYGLGFAGRRITVSTVGLAPRICRLGQETTANLAVSLNASDNETRTRIMPINKRFPIEKLLEQCQLFPLRPGRRITYEYVMIADLNDSIQDAKRLAGLLRPSRSKINLIPFNPHPGSEFQRPSESRILEFQAILLKRNFTTIIRNSKGSDISAACGQLRGKHLGHTGP